MLMLTAAMRVAVCIFHVRVRGVRGRSANSATESRLGRVLHKAGAVLHSPSLTKKGAQKDVADAEARADGLVAN